MKKQMPLAVVLMYMGLMSIASPLFGADNSSSDLKKNDAAATGSSRGKIDFGDGTNLELLIKQGFERVDFYVPVGSRKVLATIISPPKNQLDPDPVLLLAICYLNALFSPPSGDLTAQYFWKHGHRVVTFAAPGAGSLEVLRDQILAGPDPVEDFIEEAQAVLKTCVDRKWARPGRMVVSGISRFGYLAFRLMAADDQLKVGAGYSPVTDWRDLSEFKEQRNMKKIADLRLSRFSDKLAGKKIYITIGSHDTRVNTLSACQFFLDLNSSNQKRGFNNSFVEFFVTPSQGHTCDEEWYRKGSEIILNWAVSKQN